MPRVLVLDYSTCGDIETMAHAVADGARRAGATVDIKRVPELAPLAVVTTSHGGPDQVPPVARIEDLANYDAIIVGTGNPFGRMALQLAHFLDQPAACRQRFPRSHGVNSPQPNADYRRGHIRNCTPSRLIARGSGLGAIDSHPITSSNRTPFSHGAAQRRDRSNPNFNSTA